MSYIDGFVLAVPRENRQKFVEHANQGDSVFMDLGATRILECWEDDVPDGKVTDFRRAVKAGEDEAVVFSWVEWPDKQTRDAAMKQMESLMKTDPRMNPESNPMPFDGKRLIFGGFTPVVTLGTDARTRDASSGAKGDDTRGPQESSGGLKNHGDKLQMP
jgi:uncharacterized protein YbaA (DUF1428 family)